jgi:hypothetical protein
MQSSNQVAIEIPHRTVWIDAKYINSACHFSYGKHYLQQISGVNRFLACHFVISAMLADEDCEID